MCCFLLSEGKLSPVLSPFLPWPSCEPIELTLSVSSAFRMSVWDKAPKSVSVSSGVLPALLALGLCTAAHLQSLLHTHFCLLEELCSITLLGPFQLRTFCGSNLGSLISSRAQ